MRKVLFGVLLVLSFVATNVWAADTYKIDPAHTTVGFSVKHMMVSNVIGQFNSYEGQIELDSADLAKSSISATIDVASIDTNNEKRDQHLKSADFFDAAQFSSITFVSKSITSSTIVGDLTIKGVTKEITLAATIDGPVKSPMGTVIGINGTAKIDRKNFGVNWNKALDQGGLAVSNDVVINISVEAHKVEEVKAE